MIHQAVIGGTGDTAKNDGILIINKNLKTLPWSEMHLLPNGIREQNLTFI